MTAYPVTLKYKLRVGVASLMFLFEYVEVHVNVHGLHICAWVQKTPYGRINIWVPLGTIRFEFLALSRARPEKTTVAVC